MDGRNATVDWSLSVITLRHRNLAPARVGRMAMAGLLVMAALLVGAQVAAANSVECAGAVKPDGAGKNNALAYNLSCSEDIKGFSIVSNMSVAEFSTEVVVVDGTGAPAQGQQFRCEGPIPGDGFGCTGTASAGNLITGKTATEANRCVNGKNTLRMWATVVDSANAPSGPFPLDVSQKCPKVKKKKATHKPGGKKHGHKH
jgi:hypothetical protein